MCCQKNLSPLFLEEEGCLIYSFFDRPACNRALMPTRNHQKCCPDGPLGPAAQGRTAGAHLHQSRKEMQSARLVPPGPHIGGPEQPGMLGASGPPEGHPRCSPSRNPASSWAPAHLRTGWPAGKRGEPFPWPAAAEFQHSCSASQQAPRCLEGAELQLPGPEPTQRGRQGRRRRRSNSCGGPERSQPCSGQRRPRRGSFAGERAGPVPADRAEVRRLDRGRLRGRV